jgi:hypothetical protein
LIFGRGPLIRIARSGGVVARSWFTHAADNLRHRRAFSGTDKPQVFGVLNDWFDEAKKDAFGPELISLRNELDADISQKRH